MWKLLLDKAGKKQYNQTFKKSWFEGYQGTSWKAMLLHDMFLAPLDTLQYEWIASEQEKSEAKDPEEFVEQTVSKVFDIFVERSHTLYGEEDTLMWLRQIIGYTLNKIDSGDL
jgi:hypothetical protein